MIICPVTDVSFVGLSASLLGELWWLQCESAGSTMVFDEKLEIFVVNFPIILFLLDNYTLCPAKIKLYKFADINHVINRVFLVVSLVIFTLPTFWLQFKIFFWNATKTMYSLLKTWNLFIVLNIFQYIFDLTTML